MLIQRSHEIASRTGFRIPSISAVVLSLEKEINSSSTSSGSELLRAVVKATCRIVSVVSTIVSQVVTGEVVLHVRLTHPKCTKECQSTHLLNPKVVQC
jgi:hypothetical protein